MTSLVTIADRVRDFGITMSATQVDANPYMQDEWAGARHWRCVLRARGTKQRLTVYFSQGSAHTEPPTAEDVVNSLAMDAAGYENARTFEEWCGEYGYDTDSRKAERVYRNVERLTKPFKKMIDDLGQCAWQNLLYHTEAL